MLESNNTTIREISKNKAHNKKLVIAMAKNLIRHSKNNHIAFMHYFIRKRIENS